MVLDSATSKAKRVFCRTDERWRAISEAVPTDKLARRAAGPVFA